ncbi:DUF1598 domain-containing protein [Roseiconus nitratireducens]|uniref:DUF1598 domain-containing protein n=1 Tax=Roseiconus nitratireducens TaxID=2605748 RepID=A0A5M6DC38_9BACT|nr:DUF1598 domain-containing protein [Roseiconus nitratireducens]KAA5543639.1 DUF1598 domain-containing protein [Roseiconus nitratireducens]
MTRLFRPLLGVAVATLCVFAQPAAFAQNNGGGTNINFAQPIAGVDVDAKGVLKIRQFDPRLANQRLMAARQAGDNEVMRPSPLRKVSLQRLEAAVKEQLATAGQPSEEQQALAGLTAIQYVFYYPETQDIVVAGPAEGYVADPTERFVGIQSGRPTVLLEDLTTALRAYAPGQPGTGVISVSIDPTPEGLQRMQQFLASVRGRVQPSDAARLAQGLKTNLGLQTVSIRGIPDDTHFARVLVEADYRMKLIGIGLERLPMRFQSYVDRANPAAVAANAMERWYFQPRYDGIAVSEDGLAMKINERGVQLVGENERVAGGQRTATKRVNKASQAFCQDFTRQFPEIAQRVRIYAELRQLMDVSIVAAYIQEQDFYGQAEWAMPVLGDESQYSIQTRTAPEQVETAVNAVWRGNTLMTPLGGGVQMQPRKALTPENLVVDQAATSDVKQSAGPSDLQDGQWWWD